MRNRGSYAKSNLVFVFLTLLAQSTLFAQDESKRSESDSNASQLPSSDKVIADFVDALGGEMSLRSIESFELKGKLTNPHQTASFKLLCSGKRMAGERKFDGLATVFYGCDGKQYWHVVKGDGQDAKSPQDDRRGRMPSATCGNICSLHSIGLA